MVIGSCPYEVGWASKKGAGVWYFRIHKVTSGTSLISALNQKQKRKSTKNYVYVIYIIGLIFSYALA